MERQKSIYEYLSQTGVLESGNEAVIREAKKLYWKQYRTAWKQEQRKKHRSYTVSFDSKEVRKVQAMANGQQTSPTQYIKQSALNRGNGLSKELTGTIRHLLYQCYSDIEEYMEEKQIHETIATEILGKIATLEKQIVKTFN